MTGLNLQNYLCQRKTFDTSLFPFRTTRFYAHPSPLFASIARLAGGRRPHDPATLAPNSAPRSAAQPAPRHARTSSTHAPHVSHITSLAGLEPARASTSPTPEKGA